jgi:hypothetical protein
MKKFSKLIGMRNCFLLGFRSNWNLNMVCVIKVKPYKVKEFSQKKDGDRYNLTDYGEILAMGFNEQFSDATKQRFEGEYGYKLPFIVW